MTQVLERLDSSHIVVNDFNKANHKESYNKSKAFRESIAKLASIYEAYKAANCTPTARSSKDGKLLSNWISENILENQKGCTFVNACKGKFEVLSNDGVINEIKNKFRIERAIKKKAEEAEKAAKAKSERITLSTMPEKPIEAGKGKTANPVLRRYFKQHAEIQARRSEMSAEEYSNALDGNFGDIVSKLKAEGYDFVEMVNGVLTRMSNDEAKGYIAQTFMDKKIILE